jgi:LuxR family transcriptional regulator, quorum-sensing system regulator BjaR1
VGYIGLLSLSRAHVTYSRHSQSQALNSSWPNGYLLLLVERASRLPVRHISVNFPTDLLETLRIGATVDDAVAAYKLFLRQFGITSLLISGLPLADHHLWKRSIICDHWPREWYDRYLTEGHYRFDPCVQKCRRTIHAFMWSDLHETRLEARQRLVLSEAADFRMRNGLCIPIHRPFQPPAVITLSGEDIQMSDAERVTVEILSSQLFQTVCRLTTHQADEPDVILTPRELEVLQAMADGKAAADAACIMGLSKHTIERHLLNIRTKTDATNTTHAVAKSLRTHQIY